MDDNHGDAQRVRGREVTRLEAFVDAAFAFAVTLLVISVDAIPRDAGALIAALKGVPAFAASFALLAMLWWTHANWSRQYGLQDGRSVWLSLLLVFLVLVYVYPLRLMFASFFAWISGGWLSSGFGIDSGEDVAILFGAYALAWTTLGLVTLALYRHSWRRRDDLRLDPEERIVLRGQIAAQAMIPLTGVLAILVIVLALAIGKPALAAMSGFAYALMSLSGLAMTRAQARARQKTA